MPLWPAPRHRRKDTPANVFEAAARDAGRGSGSSGAVAPTAGAGRTLTAAAAALLRPVTTAFTAAGRGSHRLLLSARHCDAEALNDFSLAAFFDRIIEFTVSLALLLARLPWPFIVVTTAFARACSGFIGVMRLVPTARSGWREAASRGRSTPLSKRTLDVLKQIVALPSFVASWPAVGFAVVRMIYATRTSLQETLKPGDVLPLLLCPAAGAAAEIAVLAGFAAMLAVKAQAQVEGGSGQSSNSTPRAALLARDLQALFK